MSAGDVQRSTDPLYRTTVAFNFGGVRLDLATAHDLFSGDQVDIGTKALCKSLTDVEGDVLDIGCGYGPIGLWLKARDPSRAVEMVDRDAVAVSYTQANAEANGLPGVSVHGSLGYDDIEGGPFDVIACNVPGKAGERAMEHILTGGAPFLCPGGRVAVVVVAPLGDAVERIVGAAGGEIVFRDLRSQHLVLHYRLPPGDPTRSGLGQGVYDRDTVTTDGVELTTVRGLPEFDTPSFGTTLALKALSRLKDRPRSVLVVNPGQGHVALAAIRRFEPDAVELVDRDLLALRNTARHLGSMQVESRHQPLAADGPPVDLAIVMLRRREPARIARVVVDAAAARVARGGAMLVAGMSGAVTRALEGRGGRVELRRRKSGHSAALVRPA